jgi:hypothetical protein
MVPAMRMLRNLFWVTGCALLAIGSGCAVTPVEPLVPATYLGEDVFEPSSFVSAPMAVSGRDTQSARRLVGPGTRAEALLEYVVDETGQLLAARVVHTNHPAYAREILRSLHHMQWVPGQRAGEAVKVRVQQEFFLDAR